MFRKSHYLHCSIIKIIQFLLKRFSVWVTLIVSRAFDFVEQYNSFSLFKCRLIVFRLTRIPFVTSITLASCRCILEWSLNNWKITLSYFLDVALVLPCSGKLSAFFNSLQCFAHIWTNFFDWTFAAALYDDFGPFLCAHKETQKSFCIIATR